MRKHLFTIRWMRKGTTAFPALEFHRVFDWPDTIPPNDAIKCAARIIGTTPEKIMEKHAAGLPPDAEEVMRLLPGLHLRCRFSPETEGPYLVPDSDNLLSEELLLTWVTYNEDKLKEYRI
jgi:hypothetical protein